MENKTIYDHITRLQQHLEELCSLGKCELSLPASAWPYNHKSSFRDPNKRLSTELSKHIWPLKDAKIGFYNNPI